MALAQFLSPENLEDQALRPSHLCLDPVACDDQPGFACRCFEAIAHLAVIAHGGSGHIEAHEFDRFHCTTTFTSRLGTTTTLMIFFPSVNSSNRGSAIPTASVPPFAPPA